MEGIDHTEVLRPIPRGRLVWWLLAERFVLRGREIKIDCDSKGTPLQLRFGGPGDRMPTLAVPLREPSSVRLLCLRMPPSEVVSGVDVEAWLIPVSPQGDVLAREWIPAGYASRHVRVADGTKLWWDLDHLERVLAPAGVAISNDVSPLARENLDPQIADGLEVNSHGSPLVRGSYFLNLWMVAVFVGMWIATVWSIAAAFIIFAVFLFPAVCVALISWIAYTTGWLETDPGERSASESGDASSWANTLW